MLFHAAVRILRALAGALPRPVARAGFAAVGDVVRCIDRPAVARIRRHLALAFGDSLAAGPREALLRRTFRTTGRHVADLLRATRGGAAEASALVRFSGLEHLDEALARGRGVVALSAHLGNWELMGAALAARGYPVTVVARELFDPRSDRLLNDWRVRCGIRVVPRARGLLPVVRALRRGSVVGALVDQDTAGPSVWVPFFGRLARTSKAPFSLARRTGAALVPMWIVSGPDGGYRVTIRPPLALHDGPDPEAALAADAAAWNALLETVVRAHPDEWVWHHRRWKTPPPGRVPIAPVPVPAPADAPAADSSRVFSAVSPCLPTFPASSQPAGTR